MLSPYFFCGYFVCVYMIVAFNRVVYHENMQTEVDMSVPLEC